MNDVNTNSTSAVVRKRTATWDGIRLEHCQLRPGELPAHNHREHVVLLSLTDGCKGELITSSGIGMRGTQTRGNVCVLPSGLEHQVAIEGNSENLALYVDPMLIKRAASEAELSGNIEILERYTRRDNVINSVGMALLGELETEGLSGRLYAESLSNVLAVHLLRYYSVSTARPVTFTGGLSAKKLREVTEFISDNYNKDLKLAQLAQVAGMSNFHFAREFKRTTGTTPHQYLIKFRVERAKALLVKNELPLIEVGLQTGFSHQSHFTRLFRRVTGITPNAYRLARQA
ncbi:MAG TPA: AraC family transcriptional regulator [Pyrinomonadaceae bacterium]|nr:AraC family transcriptional regulator [Pyrinomonadaceae bacterium]